MVRHFEDHGRGGFFFTSDDHEEMLDPQPQRSRRRTALRCAASPRRPCCASARTWTPRRFGTPAGGRSSPAGAAVRRAPSAHAATLVAADFMSGPVVEVAIVGDPADPGAQALIDVVRKHYLPRLAVAADGPVLPSSGWRCCGESRVDGRPGPTFAAITPASRRSGTRGIGASDRRYRSYLAPGRPGLTHQRNRRSRRGARLIHQRLDAIAVQAARP